MASGDKTTDARRARSIEMQMLPRCGCGRIVSTAKPHGWFRYGEHGTEEGVVCPRCLPAWTPQDGRRRGPEAGYCGVKR
jgi:hypothetical protein